MSAEADQDNADVKAALNGDGSAYARLMERHQVRIAARMWRFTRERVSHEELVQDVFVQAFIGLRTFRGDAPFEHWLARVATSVGYAHWKVKLRQQSRQMVPIEDWDQVLADEPHAVDASRAAELLHSLLERLPPRDRMVLQLRYVEDRSVEETAELLGWTCTMVKVQAWRGRNKLKKLLREAGLEVDH